MLSELNKLFKLGPFIDVILEKCKANVTSGQDLVMDELMVPGRRHLYFRQYIKNKLHMYGVKMYKLCTTNYTPKK